MSNRKLGCLLNTERIHDYDEFHKCPLAQQGGEKIRFIDNPKVACGQGGNGMEDWEWSISFFHEPDENGVDVDTYVLPPYLTGMINSFVGHAKSQAISDARNAIFDALKIE